MGNQTGARLNLGLHPKQALIFKSPARLNCVNAGRGFGKSRLMLTQGITKCLGYSKPLDPLSPVVGMIVMPTRIMAKSIHFEPMLDVLEGKPFIDSIDRTDMRIRFKGRKPDLILRSCDDNGSKLRGSNPFWVGGDEVAMFHPEVWTKALLPALARNRDWSALLISTPLGTNNHWYERCKEAVNDKEFGYFKFGSKDNPFFPRGILAHAEQTLPKKIFDQEFNASWLNFEGQIYGSLGDSNITSEIPLSFQEVFIGCDWGDSNPALAVVGLTSDGTYWLVDSWEPPNGGTFTEADVVKEASTLWNKWGTTRIFCPDDRPAMVLALRRAGMKGAMLVSRREPGVEDGNRIIDSLFYQHRFYLNANLASAVSDFRSYRRKRASDGTILHDIDKSAKNHIVDAARYCVATLEFQLNPLSLIPKTPPGNEWLNPR